MNAEKILTEVYWDLSPLSADQIKYPDHDTLRKCLKKYLNSKYGIIIAKEGKMAGFLNEQVQEWYKNNTDLLGVIEKLTNRCKKLEEENESLKDEFNILKDEFDIKVKVVKTLNDYICKINKRCGELEEENTHLKNEVKAAVSREEVTKKNLENSTHEVTELNRCLSEKDAKNKELRCKVTDLECRIRQYEEDRYLIDQQRKKAIDSYATLIKDILKATHSHTIEEALNAFKYWPSYPVAGMIDIKLYRKAQDANNQLRKKVEDLQASYDNCVNECADHVIEIDSLLQNLEVETVEQGIEKIKVLKDGCLITFNFSAEADLRVENEKLKKKIEDLRKDVKFEFDSRMTELAASTELKETVGRLRQKNYDLSRVLQEESIGRKRAESENAKLKSFIKGQTNLIHSMTDAIEQRLADLREEKNNE